MSLANIDVKIGADTSALRSGVNQAKQALGSLKSAAGQIGANLAAVFSVGVVRQFVGEIARIQDLADRFGIGAEQMQRLGFVASQNGADIETMASALQRATVAAEAAMNGNKKAADAFADLNINVRDFAKASPEEKLAMLADGFNGAASEGQAMAAVLAIAGKSAGEMIPALRQGGDAIRETAGSIQVASAETVAALAEMDDAFDKFGASAKAPIAELIALILKLGTTITDLARGSGAVIGETIGFIRDNVKAVISGDAEGFKEVTSRFRDSIEQIVDDWKTNFSDTWNPTIAPKPQRFGTLEDGVVNPEVGDEEYGPAGDAAIEARQRRFQEERDQRLEDARRYYAFLESKRALRAGISEVDQQLANTSQFAPLVTSDFRARGFGGAVYGGAENPVYKELQAQRQRLEDQITLLEGIETNTARKAGMKP